MKFCAVICEYNPFHNGHVYQIRQIRKISGCDRVICLMSGGFTQRGDAAVFDKYTRARHAILGGADAVLELPAAFATAPAELFARGAVHILASIPDVKMLAFGCESGTAEAFMAAAKASLREDKAFKAALKEHMQDGTSYVKARTEVLLTLNKDIDEALLTAPNNMLGVEYCRAILAENADMVPLPIARVGSGYADTSLYKEYSSASALRAALGQDKLRARHALKSNLPEHVYQDAINFSPIPYGTAALAALLTASADDIAATPDCSEGLENRLLTLVRSNPVYEELLDKTVSRRHTRSRIKRILLQNFLGIRLKDVRNYVSSPLYCRTLALRQGDEQILSALAAGKFPLVTRKSDFMRLKKEALACFALDIHANALYSVLASTPLSDCETLFL